MRGGGRPAGMSTVPMAPPRGARGRPKGAGRCGGGVQQSGTRARGGTARRGRPAAAPPRPLAAGAEGECVADGAEGACCWEWSSLGLISWHGFRAQQLCQVISSASALIPFTLCMYSASPRARLLSLAHTPFCSLLV